MELKLVDGDYLPDGAGDFQRLAGAEEVLGRVLFLLSARRGSFAPFPELGSRLYALSGVKATHRLDAARSAVLEALAGERDLTVTDVELEEQPEGGGFLRVYLRWSGGDLTAQLEVD